MKKEHLILEELVSKGAYSLAIRDPFIICGSSWLMIGSKFHHLAARNRRRSIRDSRVR